MNSWLLFYLIGVLAGLVLIFIANKDTNIKNWKADAILVTLLYTLGSWIFVFIVAIRGILDN